MLRLPESIIADVENETDGLRHGIVTLSIHLRDGHPRYVISRERSIMTDTQGEGVSSPIKNYSADKNKMSSGMRK
jgi:hypothetical protein